MPRMIRSLFALIACLDVLGTATTAHAGDNQRRQWFKKYDDNKDKRLKGKEVRSFKKAHPGPYEKLKNWCDKAKEKPKKNGVKFPKGEKERKFKCKKKRIDNPYVKAWIAAANPPPKKDKPTHPSAGKGKDQTVTKPKPKPEHPAHPRNPCGGAENPCEPVENPCGPVENPCGPANPCNPCG